MTAGRALVSPDPQPFPAAEFETSKRAMRAGLASSATDPAALANNRLARALSPFGRDDLRYVPTIEENLVRADAVTLEQVKAPYEAVTAGEVAAAFRKHVDPRKLVIIRAGDFNK